VVIEIDLSSLPKNLKSAIIDEIDGEFDHQLNVKNQTNVEHGDGKDIILEPITIDRNVITIDYNIDLQKIERLIKDILIKKRIGDYVVIQDTKENNKIIILKRHHGEQLGIYHCRHCGMAFDNEIQLSTHQRVHFFI
jgi:mRNA-degrading endonuclease RelE of RelBE toxin-antitoxin system